MYATASNPMFASPSCNGGSLNSKGCVVVLLLLLLLRHGQLHAALDDGLQVGPDTHVGCCVAARVCKQGA